MGAAPRMTDGESMTMVVLVFLVGMFALVMLARHHGEGGGGDGGAQAGLGEVHHLVVFACRLLDELVGCQSRGGDPDDEVDVLAKINLLGQVLEKVSRGVRAMGVMMGRWRWRR